VALNPPPDLYPLPCGHSLDELWISVQTGTHTVHQQSCPHCRTAADGLTALADATRALQADAAEPSADLLGRIMTAVRTDLRRGRTFTLPGERGPIRMSEQAAAAVLRYAADTVNGVRARRCRIETIPDRPDTIRIYVALALRYRTGPADAVLDQVRRRLAVTARASLGLVIEAVDLEVVDLWPLERNAVAPTDSPRSDDDHR